MSHIFGKIPIVAGQRTLEDVGGTGLSGVVIGNESGLTCQITLVGAGVNRTLYPGTADLFEVPDGKSWNGNLQIDPSSDLSNASSWPSSFVQVDTFGYGEKPTGVYPISFFRAGNIGNTVSTNTVSAATTNVTNDGNPGNTVFIEATQSGNASGSNVVDRNDGSFYRSQFVSNVLTRLLELAIGANPLFKIGAGVAVQQADANGVFGTLLKIDSSGNNILQQHPTGQEFQFWDSNGNILFVIDGTGHLVVNNNQSIRGRDTGGTPQALFKYDTSNNVLFVTGTSRQLLVQDNVSNTNFITFDGLNQLLGILGTKQTMTGDTSGTFDIYEFLIGPVKIVIGVQTNFRQNGAAQFVTLKNAFTAVAFILNFGNGGVITGTGNVADTNRQVTWGTGTTGGSQANNAQIPQDAAGFTVAGFTQVGNPGGYAAAHGGVCCWIGV